jgi:rare lipoprotein A
MKRLLTLTALLILTSVAALPGLGCTSSKSRPDTATSSGAKSGYQEKGIASWYGGKFHGRTTASGERYDMNKLTAAHKKLPFGSRVLVTNLDNGRQVEVRITDRGPFIHGRIIDLSREAARRIDMIQAGTARVRIEVIG